MTSTLAKSIGQAAADQPPLNRPVTPPPKPFQHPPTTQTRESHSTYLEQRISDHIDEIYPLTPSYQVSLRSYNEYTVRKITEVKLIEHNESERQRAAKEKAKLKAGGSRYVQKSGVIRVGDARAQIAQRETEEWLREENRHVTNMAEQRAQRAVVLEGERQARLAATQLEREKKALIKATEKQEQDHRKEAVKIAVRELGKAITRAGLRSHNGPGKEAWRALEIHVKHKGVIYDGDIPEAGVDEAQIDSYVRFRLERIKIMALWGDSLVIGEKERSIRRSKGIQAMLKYGDLYMSQRELFYVSRDINGNMS